MSNDFMFDGGSSKHSDKEEYLTNFQRKHLLKVLEQQGLHDKYRQRINIMLLADKGKTQSQICEELNCSRLTARQWMLMAESGQAHKWKSYPLGRPKIVNEQYKERLKELVNQSPKNYGYSFKLWTAESLRKHLDREFSVKISCRHINRLLKEMGLSTRAKLSVVKDTKEDIDSNGLVIKDLNSKSVSDSFDMWLMDITLNN